jgi:polyisoprenoid-binding protein YceI
MTDYTGNWVIDPASSSVGFVAKTLWGLMSVKGTFSAPSGQGTVAADGTASGTLTIDAGTVSTRNGGRDKHLKSAAFFNAEAHPQITVTISSATQDGSTLKASGTLQVAGHSADVAFDAAITAADDNGITLQATVPVNYRKLGMTWNQLGAMAPVATTSVTARFTRAPDAATA